MFLRLALFLRDAHSDLRRPAGYPARHGFLPKAELESLSSRTQTPLYQIPRVAAFIRISSRRASASGSPRMCGHELPPEWRMRMRADIERRFANARRSEVEIRDVSCLGRCDAAPAIAVNDHIFTDVTADHSGGSGPCGAAW